MKGSARAALGETAALAALGALQTLAFVHTAAWPLPLQASTHDIGLLAALGVFQLAIPCVLAVRLARALPAPEISLLALLEIVFGIAWVWWGTSERPSAQVLAGGALVLTTLAVNEFVGMRKRG